MKRLRYDYSSPSQRKKQRINIYEDELEIDEQSRICNHVSENGKVFHALNVDSTLLKQPKSINRLNSLQNSTSFKCGHSIECETQQEKENYSTSLKYFLEKFSSSARNQKVKATRSEELPTCLPRKAYSTLEPSIKSRVLFSMDSGNEGSKSSLGTSLPSISSPPSDPLKDAVLEGHASFHSTSTKSSQNKMSNYDDIDLIIIHIGSQFKYTNVSAFFSDREYRRKLGRSPNQHLLVLHGSQIDEGRRTLVIDMDNITLITFSEYTRCTSKSLILESPTAAPKVQPQKLSTHVQSVHTSISCVESPPPVVSHANVDHLTEITTEALPENLPNILLETLPESPVKEQYIGPTFKCSSEWIFRKLHIQGKHVNIRHIQLKCQSILVSTDSISIENCYLKGCIYILPNESCQKDASSIHTSECLDKSSSFIHSNDTLYCNDNKSTHSEKISKEKMSNNQFIEDYIEQQWNRISTRSTSMDLKEVMTVLSKISQMKMYANLLSIHETQKGKDQEIDVQTCTNTLNLDKNINQSGEYSKAKSNPEILILQCDLTNPEGSSLVHSSNTQVRVVNSSIHDTNTSSIIAKHQGKLILEHCKVNRTRHSGLWARQNSMIVLRKCSFQHCMFPNMNICDNSSVIAIDTESHSSEQNGIALRRQSTGLLYKCKFFNNNYPNIHLTEESVCKIEISSIFKGNMGGIWMKDKSIAVLSHCNIYSNNPQNVLVSGKAKPTIKFCEIHSAMQQGILVKDSASGTFKSNNIYSNTHSNVELQDNANPFFEENRIYTSLQCGIYIHDCSQGKFYANQIFENQHSNVFTCGRSSPIFKKNEVYSGKQSGICCKDYCKAVFEENNVHNNAYYNVKLSDFTECTIIGNKIHECSKAGICVRGYAKGVISHNQFTACDVSILIEEILTAAPTLIGNIM